MGFVFTYFDIQIIWLYYPDVRFCVIMSDCLDCKQLLDERAAIKWRCELHGIPTKANEVGQLTLLVWECTLYVFGFIHFLDVSMFWILPLFGFCFVTEMLNGTFVCSGCGQCSFDTRVGFAPTTTVEQHFY